MPRSLRIRQDCIDKAKLAVKRNGYNSQKALAEDLGLALATVSNFLTGKPVDHATFVEICQRLVLNGEEIADLEVNALEATNTELRQLSINNDPVDLDDNKWIDVTRLLLTKFKCEEIPIGNYSDDQQSRKKIRELCNNAFHESGIYNIIKNIIGDPFGAYVLLYVKIHGEQSIPITVAITEEGGKEYLINQAVNRVVESSELNELNKREVNEDIKNSENDDTNFGQWLLKHPPIIYNTPPLGVLALLNKLGKHFRDLSEEDCFSNFPAFRYRDDKPPLVYAIEVPGSYDSESIENNSLPLKKSLGRKVVEGREGQISYRQAMQKLAEAVRTTDYYGQDKEISEVFFMPVLLNPRINLLLMPTDKAKIPRSLTGLLLLRRCAELLHSKFVEFLLEQR